MSRNATMPFGEVPGVKIPRCKINKPHTLKTTFNAGKLVPIYCNQVLPGQTVEMDLNSFIRMATPITPVMDDLIADVYFFFVPTRFLWSNWERFLGANDLGSWAQTTTYVPPKVGATGSTIRKYDQDDLGAYIGVYPQNVALPILSSASDVSPVAFPLTAYMKCWNDWFRNENLEKEIPLPTGNIGISVNKSNNFYSDIVLGYGLAPVNKTADIFTRSLPAPQKGDSIRIPVNQGPLVNSFSFANGQTGAITNLSVGVNSGTGPATIMTPTSTGTTSGVVNLSSSALGTINDLRNAFAIQRMLEKDARGGTRYIELLKSHFGVSNGDLRLGRSEYLGGKRFGINMNQVVQAGGSADSSSPTPLGSTAGVSVTGDHSSLFTKSFTEHGWLIGVCCVRIKQHTYSQGINRQYFMNTRYDLYWPSLANIGEQAVYKKEIYAGSATTANINKDVFGYQEAWYQYRYNPNRLSGYFATQNSNSLSVWHYGDLYGSAPSLTSDFSHEDKYQIDRTIALSSETSHQFLADFFFNEKDVLPMPLYSVPGLVDHY